MLTAVPVSPDPDALMSETEARRLLGNPAERTMRRWRNRGLLPFVRLSCRTLRYRRRDVLEFIARRVVNQTETAS